MLEKFTQKAGKGKILYSDQLIEFLGGIANPQEIIIGLPEGVDPKTVKPNKVKAPKAGKKTKAARAPKQSEPEPEQAMVIHVSTTNAKDQLSIANQIFQAYELGNRLLRDCCDDAGVSFDQLQTWISTDPKIFAAYGRARKNFKDNAFSNIQDMALIQIQRSIAGYNVDLYNEAGAIKMGPNGEKINIPDNYKIQKKHVIPRSDLIMFALTNRAPDDWKRTFLGAEAGDEKPNPLDLLTPAEMMAYLDKAKAQGIIGTEEKKI